MMRTAPLSGVAGAAALLVAAAWCPTLAQATAPDSPPASASAPAAGQGLGRPMTPDEENKTRAGLELAIRTNSKSPEPYIVLSAFKMSRGDLAGAVATVNDGIAAAPNASELRVVLARLYLLQNRNDDAVAAYQKAIELDPKAVAPRLELGDAYRAELRQPEKSLAIYNDVLAIDEKNVAARLGLGQALANLNRLDEAFAALTEAQRLAPGSAPISYTLGQFYAMTGKPNEAIAAFDRALTSQRNYVDAHIAKGRVLQVTGKRDEAIAEYNAALLVDKKAIGALIGSGMIYQATGQTAAAEEAFREALNIDKDNLIALNSLAWMAAEKKTELNEALAWATRAASIAPNQPDILDTLGWVLRQRGELPKAAEVLEHAVKLRQTTEIYTHLGTVRADMGDKNAAAEAFNAALKLTPDYAAAKDGLSKLK
jgi:tetratricopeptide (TPR) repeat protein